MFKSSDQTALQPKPLLDRRSFLQSTGCAVIAGIAGASLSGSRAAWAAPSTESDAERRVLQLYQSLSDEQKKTLVFPFDHELRRKISANWHITKPLIHEDYFTPQQRKLIMDIVRHVTSPDGFERLQKQAEYDSGGLDRYSIALFGTPGAGPFEFELTGRHLTLRADGNSVDKAAFGGPIVYGHGEGDPNENLFHYQTKQVNEVFQALDAKQAEVALLAEEPKETAVELQGPGKHYPGISYTALTADQKALVEKTLRVLLAPYRETDVEEVFAILKATGGLDQLHLAFYQQGDLGQDRVWDVWRVEGPSLVWHFRGAPHVHAYINVGIVEKS